MLKLVVIGLDCVTPQLAFEAWQDEMPHLKGLMQRGRHARMVSMHPPITVPAWTAMMTSRREF